jgi:hypothetical protein
LIGVSQNNAWLFFAFCRFGQRQGFVDLQ